MRGSRKRIRKCVRAEVTRSYADVAGAVRGRGRFEVRRARNLAVPGAPLLTIEREGAYRLEAAVEESHLAAIRVGQAGIGHAGRRRSNHRCAGFRDRAGGGCGLARLHRQDRSARRFRRFAPAYSDARRSSLDSRPVAGDPAGCRDRARPVAIRFVALRITALPTPA